MTNINIALGLKEGDYCMQAEHIAESNLIAVITTKKKYLYFMSISSKYLDIGERKIVKRIPIPKGVENKKMKYVEQKDFIFFYGDSPQIDIFDLKKETFLKTSVCKALESRRGIITALSVSQCQNYMVCTDECGDLQLWAISSKGLEALYANNISTCPLIGCQFLMNSYRNDISEAVCLGLDNVLYIVGFDKQAKHNFRVTLSNKLYLGKTEELTYAEYKSLKLSSTNDLKTSFAGKWLYISGLEVIRTKEGSLLSSRHPLLYKIKEEMPLNDLVAFEKFSSKGLEGFDSSKLTFETKADLYYSTTRFLVNYNLGTLQCRSVVQLDQIFKDSIVQSVRQIKIDRRDKHSVIFLSVSCFQSGNQIAVVLCDKTGRYLGSWVKPKSNIVAYQDGKMAILSESLAELTLGKLLVNETESNPISIETSHSIKFAETISRIDLCRGGGEIIAHCRARECIYKINTASVRDGEMIEITSTTISMKLLKYEYAREIFQSPTGTEPWDYGVLTNQRLLLLKHTLEPWSQIDLEGHLTSIKYIGSFASVMVFEDNSFVYYFDARASSSLVKMFYADDQNERLLTLMPDRAVMAKCFLDDKDKEVKLEIQQRHCLNTELLLIPHIFYSQTVQPKVLECLLGIFWESTFSLSFLTTWAKKATSKLDLEIILKYGGIDLCFTDIEEKWLLLDHEAKGFLRSLARDYLCSTTNGTLELADLFAKIKIQPMSDVLKTQLLLKVNKLVSVQIIPSLETSSIISTLNSLANSDLKRHRLLKKREVAFGSDSYRYTKITRIFDSRLSTAVGLINPKELPSFFGYSKPRVNTLIQEASDEEVLWTH